MGTPSKVLSRPAVYMQTPHFFADRFVTRSGLIIKEPKFYLREYEPRKNSGIRGLSLRTEGAFGNAVFEGLHTPRSALRLFYNCGIYSAPVKKCKKICIYAIFVVPLCPNC